MCHIPCLLNLRFRNLDPPPPGVSASYAKQTVKIEPPPELGGFNLPKSGVEVASATYSKDFLSTRFSAKRGGVQVVEAAMGASSS